MSGNIADRLGLSSEVREFKLGKSFTERSGNAFHSVRYDFKPASVDTSKMATVDIGESHQVTVTVPHVEGTAQTVFRGSRRPYQKECVLIIDHNTGEITLEKLGTNIQLKKTRAEGSSRALLGRPITPIENPPQGSASASHSQPAPNPKRPSPNNNHSMFMSNPSRNSNGHNSNRNNVTAQALPPSMPQLIGKDNNLIVEPQEVLEVGVLSDSSGSDSSSSSEEDNDDDKIHEPEDELAAMILSGDQEPMDTSGPGKPSSSGSSSSSSSDSDDSDDVPNPSKVASNGNKPPAIPSNNKPNKHGNSALDMPKFSQLSEDLQLSESGSDSDD